MLARRRCSLAVVVSLCVGALVLVFGGTAALAAAPEAPEVVVEAPVHATTAVVRGVLSPLAVAPGEAGEYEFLYREGGSCEGGSSAPVPAGLALGLAHEEVSETLTGLQPDAEYTVCLRAEDGEGSTVGAPVSLRTALPPEAPVTGSPAKSVTAGSATLEGVLNPGAAGDPGSYEFVYRQSASECQGEGQQATPMAGAGGAKEESVQAEVSGLLPNAVYTFCLLARNEAGEEAVGPAVSFTTLAVKPSIDAASATNVTASSAEVHARIDPNGADATYRFEYGTTPSYGASVPVPAGDAGAGRRDVPVSALLAGLSANTTYHWRVIASGAGGTSTGPDQTFVYDTSGSGLPDGRAYELVTPSQKNGALLGAALFGGGEFDISEDGSRVVLPSIQCFADSEACTGIVGTVTGEPFAFTRSSGGWTTVPFAPSAAMLNVNGKLGINADAGTALSFASTPPAGAVELYARRPDGSFRDVGPVASPSFGHILGAPQIEAAATADLSHIVYGDLGFGSFWPFDATVPGSGRYLYEYVGVDHSQPELVGVTGPAGSTSLVSECGTALGSLGGSVRSPRNNALSADGRTVFFTAVGHTRGGGNCTSATAPPANELYARIDGSQTVLVSGRSPLECTSATGCLSSPPGDAEFEGASEDGSKVFFMSTQQLTDSASEDAGGTAYSNACTQAVVNGCNLYEYDFANPEGRKLVDVSAGDTSGGGPLVQGVAAISADGSHVYFVAKGVLSAVANDQGQTARDGGENLYVFERDASHPEGRVAFVATLSTANLHARGSDSWLWTHGAGGAANVTPDGRFLVFTSQAALTTDDTSTTGTTQVFRYDAQTAELVRISIGEQGFNDNGNAGIANASIVAAVRPGLPIDGPLRGDPTMSHDGAYVFFQSPVGLTPQALDDVQIGTYEGLPTYAQNVYEWHAGHVYLISDGRDVLSSESDLCQALTSVCLLGSDATGANVFFTSADRLVPQDVDSQVDLYDARICSASQPCVTPPAPTAPCQGEACHGTPAGTPPPPSGATVTFSGPGNLAPTTPTAKPGAKHKAKAKKHKRKAKHRAKRSSARHKRGGHSKARGR